MLFKINTREKGVAKIAIIAVRKVLAGIVGGASDYRGP